MEQELLLGTDTDQAVAESLGRSVGMVAKRRRELGIAPFRLGSRTRGRTITTMGYVKVRVDPDDPFREMADGQGYAREHRLVMARHLGRLLLASETVHHRNGLKTDNRLENLELWTGSHPSGQTVSEIFDWCVDFIARYADEVDRL